MNREDALRFIDAYVDDELGVKDALEIQAWIARDSEFREEYERIVALKSALREKLGGEEVQAPEMLKRRVMREFRRARWQQTGWLRPALAAAAAVVLVLGWAGYHRAVAVPRPLVADTMMVYKVEMQNPLDYRSSDIQEVSSWLQERFQQEVKPPIFKEGRVVGVRLCPFLGKKGAAVIYRVGGRNIALFIGERKGLPYAMPMLPSFKVAGRGVYEAEQDGFRLAFWSKGMWFYALVAEDSFGHREGVQTLFSKGAVTF